jgi:hypothetical protein
MNRFRRVIHPRSAIAPEIIRDEDGHAVFSFAEREWPHGWTGVGAPHAAVYSR